MLEVSQTPIEQEAGEMDTFFADQPIDLAADEVFPSDAFGR